MIHPYRKPVAKPHRHNPIGAHSVVCRTNNSRSPRLVPGGQILSHFGLVKRGRGCFTTWPTVENSPAFFISPVRKPIRPQQNICHGVHGPCPNRKLLTNAVNAPVRKPVSGPKTTAVIMITALQGLKFGSGTIAKTARPTTAMAAITATGTSSRA